MHSVINWFQVSKSRFKEIVNETKKEWHITVSCVNYQKRMGRTSLESCKIKCSGKIFNYLLPWVDSKGFKVSNTGHFTSRNVKYFISGIHSYPSDYLLVLDKLRHKLINRKFRNFLFYRNSQHPEPVLKKQFVQIHTWVKVGKALFSFSNDSYVLLSITRPSSSIFYICQT